MVEEEPSWSVLNAFDQYHPAPGKEAGVPFRPINTVHLELPYKKENCFFSLLIALILLLHSKITVVEKEPYKMS